MILIHALSFSLSLISIHLNILYFCLSISLRSMDVSINHKPNLHATKARKSQRQLSAAPSSPGKGNFRPPVNIILMTYTSPSCSSRVSSKSPSSYPSLSWWIHRNACFCSLSSSSCSGSRDGGYCLSNIPAAAGGATSYI